MTSNVSLEGLLDSARSDSDPSATDLDQTNKYTELVQKVYGDALYYELKYRRHLKELQDFDLKRDQYHRQLQDSAYERNKHLRVMTLPAEILSLIFHCMRLPQSMDDSSSYEMFPFRQKTAEWVFVTWVCRYWRNVALNDATLWTIVPHHWSKWTPEIIERSRSAGLKVDFIGAENSQENYACMLKHSDCISQLYTNNEALAHILSVYGPGSMPKLEKLRVIGYALGGYELTNSLLPTNIFNDNKNLRHLELSGMHVVLNPKPLPSIFRSSLRHLRLFSCSFMTMEDFKPAIKKIECLESLVLHDTISRHAIASRGAPISLTYLKSLYLLEDSAGLVWFFNNFSLTAQRIHIRVVTCLPSKQNGDHLRVLAAMSLPGALGQAISDTRIVAFEMNWVSNSRTPALSLKARYEFRSTSSEHLRANRSCDLAIAMEQIPPSPFPLSLRYKTFHGIFADVFHHFEWTSLSALNLVKLDFNFSPATFGKILQKTFGGLANVRSICVGKICARPLIDALWLDARQRRPNVKDGPRKEISFRGLQRVYLKGVLFERGRGNNGKVVEWARFMDCLRGRVECGVPIQKLSFSSCLGLTRDNLRVVMGVVPDIAWDGEGPESSSEEDDDDSNTDEVETNEGEGSSEEEGNTEDSEEDETTEECENNYNSGGEEI